MDIPLSKPFILDGATGTFFADNGYSYGDSLELFILSHKELLLKLQRDFIAAGSQVIYTPTLTANPFMLKKHGLEERCAELNEQLALLSVQAAEKKAYIAGDIGGSGTQIDPFSEVSFTELISMYRTQVKALQKHVDFFVVETITSISDLRAAIIACKKSGKPVIVSVSVDDELVTYESGMPVRAAMITAQNMGVSAFGVNCSLPEVTVSAMRELAAYAKVPLFAKPCTVSFDESGNAKHYSPEEMLGYYRELLELGVGALGGCCGTTPEHIRLLKGLMDSVSELTHCESEIDTQIVLADASQAYYLEPDTTEISPAIGCRPDMEESIVEVCEEHSYDVLLVDINTPDDAIDFNRNAHMATLPVMFCSENEVALKLALMLYQGRAMIDKSTMIDDEALAEMTEKYGAVIY